MPASLLLIPLGVMVLYMGCSFAAHAHRGFDFSDEGWGLLRASGAAGKYGLPLFETLYTGPLHDLAGGNVRTLRLFSLILSLATGGLFSWAFLQALAWGGVAGGVGFTAPIVLCYFLAVSFFRITTIQATPSYAILGGIACVAALSLCLLALSSGSAWLAFGTIFLAGGAVTALFFTRLPGFPVVFLLLAGLCLAGGDGRGWLLIAGLTAGVLSGLAAHHRLLPLSELRYRMSRAFEMLNRTSTQEFGFVQMVFRDVSYLFKCLWSSVRSRWYLLVAASLVPVIVPSGLEPAVLLGLVLWMGILFVVRNRGPLNKIQPNEALVMRLFLDLALLLAVYHLGNSLWTGETPPARILLLVLACALVSLGHAAYSWHLTMRNTHYAPEAWAAPALLLAFGAPEPVRPWLVAGVALCGVVYSLLRFRAGYHEFPLSYGQPTPRRDCTEAVPYGGGSLLLPPAHARFLDRLREAAQTAGHGPGHPVLPCFNSPGLVLMLQGTLPWTSQYFDHPETGSLEELGRWIAENDGETEKKALVIDLHPERTALFLRAMGLDFPKAYTRHDLGKCPLTDQNAALWQPKTTGDDV